MLDTAIILAGGFGTRLQSVVKDMPKPMAPVNGKPFLYWLLQYCSKQGIRKVVLSVGFKGEVIEKYFGSQFQNISIRYCKEEEPLGTGGAIKVALDYTKAHKVFVLNGDTFFGIDLEKFFDLHLKSCSSLSIALKEMENFNRYGVVKIDSSNVITGFDEKRFVERGNINGGIYIIHRGLFSDRVFPKKFSFEKDILEKSFYGKHIHGFVFHDYFIDIGIPDDYKRAQHELAGIAY